MDKTGRTNTQIYVCGVGMGRGEGGESVYACECASVWGGRRPGLVYGGGCASGWVGVCVCVGGGGLVSVRRWVCERVCGGGEGGVSECTEVGVRAGGCVGGGRG